MRQRAAKISVFLLLTLVLVAPTFFSFTGARAEGHFLEASLVQNNIEVGHSHSNPGQCHKIAQCEAPAAFLTCQKSSTAEKAGETTFAQNEPNRNSNVPEAQLPPPKA
jgi:hypothetical protein